MTETGDPDDLDGPPRGAIIAAIVVAVAAIVGFLAYAALRQAPKVILVGEIRDATQATGIRRLGGPHPQQ